MNKLLVASLLLVSATVTQAATLDVSSSGIFNNAEGPSTGVWSGEGTNTFVWGTPANISTDHNKQGNGHNKQGNGHNKHGNGHSDHGNGNGYGHTQHGNGNGYGHTEATAYTQSSLEFTAATASVDVVPDAFTDFDLGSLTFHNGNIWSGSEATGIDLGITLSFTNPLTTANDFTFDFDLENSLNAFTPLENSSNADTVTFLQEAASELFTFDDIAYSFQLLYFLDDRNKITNTFFVDEEKTATAHLIGRITAVSAVPVPAAVFLFAPALLGFMGLRRKAKNLAV